MTTAVAISAKVRHARLPEEPAASRQVQSSIPTRDKHVIGCENPTKCDPHGRLRDRTPHHHRERQQYEGERRERECPTRVIVNIQIPRVFLPALTTRRITLLAKLAECQFVLSGCHNGVSRP